MKKRLIVLLLGLGLLAACGRNPAGKTELTVFAAASLTETLTQLGEDYMAAHEDVEIFFNFDSSGTLRTQIQEGAVCDVFLSAGQKQMNELEGLLLPESRFDILENKVVLVGEGADSFDALAQGLEQGILLLAMGNADVPVGQYTQKILAHYGLDEEALVKAGCITYGSNAKEVTAQAAEGAVDCGIVYATDACAAGLTVVDTATAEQCGQVIYPAAIVADSAQKELAADFLAYLCSDGADTVFETVGFTPMG